jgi:hypothetical protein
MTIQGIKSTFDSFRKCFSMLKDFDRKLDWELLLWYFCRSTHNSHRIPDLFTPLKNIKKGAKTFQLSPLLDCSFEPLTFAHIFPTALEWNTTGVITPASAGTGLGHLKFQSA